jgi:hypothetical protein
MELEQSQFQSSIVATSILASIDSAATQKSNATARVQLPWSRYLDDAGNPVAVMTNLGVLLAGDDGNILVCCLNDRSYAIEVSIKPGCFNRVKEHVSRGISRLESAGVSLSSPQTRQNETALNEYQRFGPGGALGGGLCSDLGPNGVGHADLPRGEPSDSELGLLRYMVSSSKESSRKHCVEITANKLQGRLKTATGVEVFDMILPHLDQVAWYTTTITLEPLIETSQLRKLYPLSPFEHIDDQLKYRAREIKIEWRETDRIITEYVPCPSAIFKCRSSGL